jgi:hypothetical protein
VDVNPFATDLSKLSLWLATLAKDHPFTFLDHALRFGDSLVGFSRLQIGQFHWDISRPHERVLGQEQLEKKIDRVTAYRKEILEMAEDNVASILLKQQKLGLADQSLETVRRAGDLLVAAFFGGSKDKERDKLRGNYRDLFLSASRGNPGDLLEETKVVDDLRGGSLPVTPFHWEIEFPEVFARQNPGFDAFVGNPPFGGHVTLSSGTRPSYTDFLRITTPESGGKSDIVAFFFRRAFELLRGQGALGFIATNSISQGDTRYSGLRWICQHGGEIIAVRRRLEWPGESAVVVSVVHISKGGQIRERFLDGSPVKQITSFFFHGGGDDDPKPLLQNLHKCFQGSVIRGSGFTFEDDNLEATPISVMKQLVEQNPSNRVT